MQTHAGAQRLARNLLVIVCATLACSTGARADRQAVEAALSIPLTTLTGKTARIAKIRGDKPLYVKFWASWCGTCMEELPHFEASWRRFGDDVDFYYVNLGVNDSLAEVRDFATEHNLPMTTLVDGTGELADAFGVMGTPWHTLADASLVLHLNGSSAPAQIDERLAFLVDPASAAAGAPPRKPALADPARSAPMPDDDGEPALYYYLATWCDWYLQDRRPQTAQRCIRSQRMVNRLTERFPDIAVRGIASRLWTGADELEAYRSRREVSHPVSIDRDNRAFLAHAVREIPTLLLVDDGRVLYRETDFGDFTALAGALEQALQQSVE